MYHVSCLQNVCRKICAQNVHILIILIQVIALDCLSQFYEVEEIVYMVYKEKCVSIKIKIRDNILEH